MDASYPPLRLPRPDDLRIREGQVFDPVRSLWIALTPEEWVRQHAIQFLRNQGVPDGLMAIERGHQASAGTRRTDITVYDRQGSVFLVCECKAATIPMRQDALAQVMRYADTLGSRHVCVTNGKSLFAASREDGGGYRFRPGFPEFDQQPERHDV
ncbi:MAG: type I restriction enzyme HsdR N-terminal domain-containing protein [Rhodothermales bacterium]|nr:type I restriction enzyme HsdR N-terminal domain-containing protein [Rhodothermales bacterium]